MVLSLALLILGQWGADGSIPCTDPRDLPPQVGFTTLFGDGWADVLRLPEQIAIEGHELSSPTESALSTATPRWSKVVRRPERRSKIVGLVSSPNHWRVEAPVVCPPDVMVGRQSLCGFRPGFAISLRKGNQQLRLFVCLACERVAIMKTENGRALPPIWADLRTRDEWTTTLASFAPEEIRRH